MVFIKKLVMHGFKSFARKTEIIFDKGINIILGPNGSGKSNVSDALCFVLGRLSIKSMRAAKARNLLFMGSKYIKPAREATVEIVFDNTERTFALDATEVTLKRIVRYNGQGVYKINGETKTRLEVVEMLAQAGIDPYGFNLILQGQIQAIVKMHPEERRKIIEDVAGISIYESRKEKSLRELEKTEEKLKEITSILRERSAYLKNLDRERSQALRFKELELSIQRCTASILTKKMHEKEKEVQSVDASIAEKNTKRESIRADIEKINQILEQHTEAINHITKHIQQATGLEQETLHTQLSNLKAELEGLRVRREHYEHRKDEHVRRMQEMQKSLPDLEAEIRELKIASPLMAQKAQELKKKKEELAYLEEERKRALTFKSELVSLRERIKDKERQLARAGITSESFVKQLEEYSRTLVYSNEKECASTILSFRESLATHKRALEACDREMLEVEKNMSIAGAEIVRSEKIKKDVGSIDICPLCRSTITREHIAHVHADADRIIVESNALIARANEQRTGLHEQKQTVLRELAVLEKKLSNAEIELVKHRTMKEKHEQLKKSVEEEKLLRDELVVLEQKRSSLEAKTIDTSKLEEQYDSKILEIEEISSRTHEDANNILGYKEREIGSIQTVLKRSTKDLADITLQIDEISVSIKEKQTLLQTKDHQEKELQAKFKKLFEEREALQHRIQEQNLKVSELQSMVRAVEEQINYLKIGKAKLDAEREALSMELTEFSGVELIQGSIAALEERLQKSRDALQQIGSINMRALEVYDEMKKEYDLVFEKVTILEKEKLEIMNIVAEIDQKKKRSFMRTFRAMNALFSENFAKLYTKGVAFLELDNQEDIFAGGVSIVVKLAKGKYFDVTSLSGGEQTLVALSLLFAIQEYKPYHFYVFDEIDAALDKRNSERLAGLLQQYMKSGQYIVITHNDAIIMNANILYGVSMHESVSKVLSLKVNDASPVSTIIPVASNGAALAVASIPEAISVSKDASDTVEQEEEMPLDPDFAPSVGKHEEGDEEVEHAKKYDATQNDEDSDAST